MSRIKNKIETLEQKLKVGRQKEPLDIVIEVVGGECPQPPEPVEEWLTYIHQMKEKSTNGIRVITLCPKDEWEAREQLRKDTK